MVAFAPRSKPLARAHGNSALDSCRDRSSNSFNRIEIRLSIYESCDRLESFSRDPIGFEGSKWNVYEYVNSSPLMRVDPFGLWAQYPSSTPWQVPDFFWWYYHGNAEDVSLDRIGLSQLWWNTIKDQLYAALKSNLIPAAETGLKCPEPKTKTIDVGDVKLNGETNDNRIHVVAGGGVTNPMTVLGNSWITVRGSCTAGIECIKCCDGIEYIKRSFGSCDLTFTMRDKFENPLDTGGMFARRNWPGSKPYFILFTFYHKYSWDVTHLDDACNAGK